MAASTALLALNDFLLHTARPGPLISPTGLIIDKRDEFHTIAARLEQNDVIDDRYAFTALAQLLSVEDKLKSGEYLFGPQRRALEVLGDLVAGRSVLGVVDLPNGATSSAIVALLNKVRILSGTVTIPPEGMLMPGNYKISRGMTRQNIIQLMM